LTKQITEYLPLKMLSMVANNPIIVNEGLKEKAAMLEFFQKRLDGLFESFLFFMQGTWVFESNKILNLSL
jgi:hypothetical protein